MKTKFIRKTACITLLLLAPLADANACEMWRDAIIKNWHGLCNLTLDPKGPKLMLQYVELPPPPLLKMPDLVIRRYSFFVSNGTVEVTTYVRNEGSQSSLATNIGVTVTTIGASSQMMQTTPLLAAVPALAPMADRGIYLGTVQVNNAVEDVDVMTAGMVDQLTVAQPVRGTVIESNEGNNSHAYLCRVFGPVPVPGPPGC